MNNKLKQIFTYFKTLSKKQIIFGSIGLLLVLFTVYKATSGGTTTTFVTSKMGSIEEQVLVTGKSKSSSEVSLGFEKSGRVTSAPATVGLRVGSGQILASLDSSDLNANLNKALADLRGEQVKLDTVKRTSGSTYQNAYDNAVIALRDSYNKADDAVRNNADQFFRNPRDYNITFGPFTTSNSLTYIFNYYITYNTQTDLANSRHDIEPILVQWNSDLSKLKSEDNLNASFATAETNLRKIQNFLNQLSLAVNSLSAYNDSTYQAAVDGYKSTASIARTEAITALTNLLSAKQNLLNAPSPTGSGADLTFSDIATEQSKYDSLSATVDAIRADISKTIIYSPIAGVVTLADAKVGQIVTPGTTLVTVISDDKLQVEANVSEVNIGKVKVGNKVSMTFDALPNQTFAGLVNYIDPGSTIVDGVATYKVTIKFIDTISRYPQWTDL
jgi:HlyD family secretion protein